MPQLPPLIPAQHWFTDTRIKTYVQRQLLPLLAGLLDDVTPQTPAAVSDSCREHSVPYYVVLGCLGKRYFAVFVDEMAQHMFEVPVLADKSFFTGTSIFRGELIWEYLGNPMLPPRQVFFVDRILRLAGAEVLPGMSSWASRYTRLRDLFDTLDKDVLQRPRDWVEEARKLALQHKIVCAGTPQGLTFRPRKWFAPNEIAVMERTYLSSLRWLTDPHQYRFVDEQDHQWRGGSKSPRFFLLVEACLDEESQWDWRIYYRDKLDKIDATLGRIQNVPLVFLPNELAMKWATFNLLSPKSAIVLVEARHMQDPRPHILCDALIFRPERQLPDTRLEIESQLAPSPAPALASDTAMTD